MSKTVTVDESSPYAVKEMAEYAGSLAPVSPRTAVVLGSGLGHFSDYVNDRMSIPYADIAGYPTSGVEGHSGELVFGNLSGEPVMVASGRFHMYEGYDIETVTLPVKFFHELKVKNLIITNSAGSVRRRLKPGTLMMLNGHLDCTFRESSKMPDIVRGEEYQSPKLLDHARTAAQTKGIETSEGVYAWMLGPSYETPAEIEMIRELGGDAVGMSTVPEIRAAGDLGMEVLGISCLTNFAAGITNQPLTHEEVMETADRVSGEFTRLLIGIIRRIARDG